MGEELAVSILVIGVTVGRIIVGMILLVAGIGKIRNGQNRFLQAIMGYDLVPDPIAAILAHGLPWLEVLSGSMLIVGFLSQGAALLAIGLFLMFTAAIILSLIRGKQNDCGCFGRIVPVQWRLVYRNLVLIGLLLLVYVFRGGVMGVDQWVSNVNSFMIPSF